MSDIKGTNITSPIVPFTSDDKYPTHKAEFGQGGFRCVDRMDDLEAIPEERRESGMVVYVRQDPSKNNFYQLLADRWEPVEKFKTEKINNLTEIL